MDLEALLAVVLIPFIMVAIAVVIGMSMKFMTRKDEQHERQLRQLGERHGMTYRVLEDAQGWLGSMEAVQRTVEGSFHGFAVSLYTRHPSLEPNKKAMGGQVRFEPSLGLGLRLKQKATRGDRGVRTGDQAFDRAFLVEAEDHEGALRLLTGPVRAALLELSQHAPGVTMDDEAVTWDQGHMRLVAAPISDPDRLDRIVGAQREVAAALRGALQGLPTLGPVAPDGEDARESAEVEEVQVAEVAERRR